jgi:hypothetical protein
MLEFIQFQFQELELDKELELGTGLAITGVCPYCKNYVR